MIKTISFYTLGCRVNQYETRALEERFILGGYTVLPFGSRTSFTVVNTCAVTAESERKSASVIRRSAKYTDNVLVIGCGGSAAAEKLKAIPGVSYVSGCTDKELCYNAAVEIEKAANKLHGSDTASSALDFTPFKICVIPPHTVPEISHCRAFVKIQDGCNRQCSYCYIPALRGKSTLRESEEIIDEIKRLAENGYKEVIFTGIETAEYGIDGIIRLVDAANSTSGIERIRLGSLSPEMLTQAFLASVFSFEKFMPHLHISVQSPNARILRAMKRPYTAETLLMNMDSIKTVKPDCMLSADIITSFPTESESEFSETLAFVKKYKFLHIHAFPYSPRPNTVAAKMDGRIPAEEAKRRNIELVTISSEIKKQILSEKLGKSVSLLVEQSNEGVSMGHTTDFIDAFIKNGFHREGEIINGNVTNHTDERLEFTQC